MSQESFSRPSHILFLYLKYLQPNLPSIFFLPASFYLCLTTTCFGKPFQSRPVVSTMDSHSSRQDCQRLEGSVKTECQLNNKYSSSISKPHAIFEFWINNEQFFSINMYKATFETHYTFIHLTFEFNWESCISSVNLTHRRSSNVTLTTL